MGYPQMDKSQFPKVKKGPKSPRIMGWLRRDDYQTFKRLSPDDPDLPDTYDEWLKLASEQINNLKANGIVVKKVTIDPEEFAVYCRASGINPNTHTRAAFTVATERFQREGRTPTWRRPGDE